MSFIFFVRPPNPRTSTLFPYTTLFRSILGEGPPPNLQAPFKATFFPAASMVWARRARANHRSCRKKHRLEGRDRKSTRLNSSHSQNSYAVFCLKKKKNNSKLSQDLKIT